MPEETRLQLERTTGPAVSEGQLGNQADPEFFGHHCVNCWHLLYHHWFGNRDACRGKDLQDMTLASTAGHQELMAGEFAEGYGGFSGKCLLRYKREPFIPCDFLTLYGTLPSAQLFEAEYFADEDSVLVPADVAAIVDSAQQ